VKLSVFIHDYLNGTVLEQVTKLELLGYNIFNLLLFAVVFIALFFFFTILRKIILIRISVISSKSDSVFSKTVVQIIRDIKYLFYVILALYLSSRMVVLGENFNNIVRISFVVIMIYEIVLFVQNISMYAIQSYWGSADAEENENATAVNAISLITRITLWVVGVIILLSNLGIEISALVASLGVSSIAIAFALQSILADIFSSFSIYFDQPFKVGDFIIVGTDMGVVKKIGIKTTRLQTLQGQLLVIPNHELTNTRINNYKQMESRRVVFEVGVVYGTPVEKLRKIPQFIKDIIDAQDLTDFDRSHFSEIGSHSLNFETVYYVRSNDFANYRDVHQAICLGIYEKFEAEGLDFAFPTQTIIMEK